MGTFLVNAKMDHALADRVRASVSGRRARPSKRRLVAAGRIILVLLVVFVVQTIVSLRRHEHDERKRARTEVLLALRTRGEDVTERDRKAARRMEELLVRIARSPSANIATSEVLPALERPLVYVRGPLRSFGSTDALETAAAMSAKDELVTCLVDPPRSRAEKDVAAKARSNVPTDVRRLHEAVVGLRLFTPEMTTRIEHESDIAVLAKLKREVDRAPVEGAKRAARAEFLLAAMDEPGEGPTELDGEQRHHVRVVLVNLVTERTVLDVRKLVDPSWISAERRPMHARAYDSCLLAVDVRGLGTP
jgi:hypothetical protein